MAKKIYLSPSNQSNNAYATGGTNEAAQCRKIALACETALKRNGFETKVAADSQDINSRNKASNDWGADLHVPIHSNAGGVRSDRV